MFPLPDLSTASFDAQLPFAARVAVPPVCTPGQLRETRLALKVLAAPVDSIDNADPLLLRLEAKLDLALEVSLLVRTPERPALTHCRLGLEAIAWHASEPYPEGETLHLTLFPHADSALVLFLVATVKRCQAEAGGWHVIVDILQGFNEHTQRLWEKWVFRRHRRAILDR